MVEVLNGEVEQIEQEISQLFTANPGADQRKDEATAGQVRGVHGEVRS